MEMNRREFLKGGLATLGFLALPAGLFAAPLGWKPPKKPNLIFGILSDTHLQSSWDGVTPHAGFPLTYVTNAMKLFRERDIDAFMHLGDAAHRGKNVEAQYHRDIFDKFFPRGKARDGRTVEKLLVVGNHELYGNVAAGGGAWAPHIWKNPVERAKHVLCGDLPRHWETVWGEKYEEVWHKEVNGYHFFGHWHQSNADYKTIYYDSFGGFFPNIQVGACRMDGSNALDANERVTKGDGIMESVERDGKAWQECKNPSRQAMIVNVYDDMVVFERHEVGQGGKLGPDWVLPLGQHKPHPFKRDELAKTLGAPEFKNIYWLGCNLGIGHEPDHGITTVDIPKSELPAGKQLTIAVRPVSSLGTKGKSIGTTWRA